MDHRRGWCPSLWTPMESGDGLIVRLDVRADGLLPAELRALAELARTHGNGLVEITRRARLQLRGIRTATLEPLQRALVELGLASTTPSRILLNPLPQCTPLAALATELECALEAIGPLPDKFAVAVDAVDTGGLLLELGADIHLNLTDDTAEVRAAESLLGHCRIEDCTSVVSGLARRFAERCGPELTRLRDLLRVDGPLALTHAIEAWLCTPPSAAVRDPRPSLIGLSQGEPNWLGLGLAFGAGDERTWREIANIAERFGDGRVRITPFRSVIVIGADSEEAARAARAAGLITTPDDPMLRASACPGAPACGSAHGETRGLARELAHSILPLLAADARLHVSGCVKGCSHTGPAEVTLVHGTQGAHLGFGCSAPAAAATPAIPLRVAEAQLFGLAHTAEGGQARIASEPASARE